MLQHVLPDGLATPYLISEWVIRIGMLFFVPSRRTPQAAQAWLLLIFFLPLPGLILYAAIGRPRFPDWRKERFHQLAPFYRHVSEALAEAGAVPDENEVAVLATHLGALPATQGNGIEFLSDYDQSIDRLIADIDAARESVRILTYIFADDDVGARVIEALCRAAARGVICHVLIDAFGSHRWSRRVLRKLNERGVDARKALPFRLVHRRTRNDMRNHRKLAVIDGRIGYAGSQNIVDKTFRPGVTNRELVARLTGPVVAEMDAVIVGDWFLETEQMLPEAPVPAPDGEALLQLLPSGADYPLEGFETLLVWQLHKAERRVVVTTPYFVPDQDVLGAMRTAVARGVEVVLIVSTIADQKLVSLAQRSYFGDLLRAGVSIWRYRDLLLHAKNVSIDGNLAILGSSNVDLRSFQLNDEVSLLPYDRESVGRLEAVQRGYIEDSDRLTLERWQARSRVQKLLEGVARLVSPLL
ncbi:MAG TPA: cardiolipin synthase [Allosphingosinicella sp.]|jgi:cardiolipin synthase|nr:cardiolipin synthase [Allosphingosinicella sp.]